MGKRYSGWETTTMSRVTVICLVEGPSENLFAERLLAPHLSGDYEVDLKAPIVTTSRDRRRGTLYKGGGRTFLHYLNDLRRIVRQYERQPNIWFTTLLDVYGLPDDFPQKDKGSTAHDPRERVDFLENALAERVRQELADSRGFSRRFIPYLMLHELETLLFTDLDQMTLIFPDKHQEIEAIKRDVRSFGCDVESINQTRDGAPSKRIEKQIRCYGRYKAKGSGGMVNVLERIGLVRLRKACPHFNAWITRLEGLGDKGGNT